MGQSKFGPEKKYIFHATLLPMFPEDVRSDLVASIREVESKVRELERKEDDARSQLGQIKATLAANYGQRGLDGISIEFKEDESAVKKAISTSRRKPRTK